MPNAQNDPMWRDEEGRTRVRQHRVVDVRATGVMPAEVATQVQVELDSAAEEGWELQLIQPIIYNSSTTGYLLLVFARDAVREA